VAKVPFLTANVLKDPFIARLARSRPVAAGLASGPRFPAYGRGPTLPGRRGPACGQVALLWTTS
jgi:hypothetical protein